MAHTCGSWENWRRAARRRGVTAAFAMTLALSLGACNNSIESAREQANIAQQRLSAGDVAGAREAILRSIRIRDDLVAAGCTLFVIATAITFARLLHGQLAG